MDNMYDMHKIILVGEYPAIYSPAHAKANSSGMVYVHILQAEKKLGRELKSLEVVHHKDFDKNNYELDNLMVFADTANHSRYHQALSNDIDYILIKHDGVYYCITGQGFIKQAMNIYGSQQKISPQMRAVCPLCGNWMSTRAKICVSCYKQQKRIKICKRPSKETLVEQLLQYRNFTKVGKMYNVTEAAVRKWCRYYKLPNKISDWKKM